MIRLAIIAGLAAGLATASPAHAQCQSITWPPSAGTCITQHHRHGPVIIAPTLNVQQNTLVQNTLIEINVPSPVFYGPAATAPVALDSGGPYVIPPAVSPDATSWWNQPAAAPCRGQAAHDLGCSGR